MESREVGRAWAVRPRKILVVRLGAIGDCLRVLPSVAMVRVAFPDAEIGWATGSLVAPLLAGHPFVDRLHVVDRSAMGAGPRAAWRELRRVAAELEAARYDVAIDFHTRLKSGYLVRASRAPTRIGFDMASGSEANFLFTNRHVNLSDVYENRVLRFARLLSPLGIDAAVPWQPGGLWIEPGAAADGAAIYRDAGSPAVALFPGTSASRARDRWPADRWRDVALRLGEAGFSSMVLWGPGERDEAATVAASNPRCSIAPPTTLAQMMALLGHFRLYAGSNTAALHMAWMQGVPAVVLAGGRPWRTDRPLDPVPSVMLTAGGVEPARKLRGDAARRAIVGITVDDVVAPALELLGWSAAPASSRFAPAPR